MKTMLFFVVFLCLSSMGFAEKTWIFERTIEVPQTGILEIKVAENLQGYNTRLIKIQWQLENETSVKQANLIFAPNRSLPKQLPYLTVQDQNGLVLLERKDKTLLEKVVESLIADFQFYDLSVSFLNLIIETENIQESYFQSTGKKNSYMDDGLVWAGGWYTAQDNQVQFVMAPVADKNTNCYGRKGDKCGRRVYSRTALNHDLCHRILGQNLGPCRDEILTAALEPAKKNLLETLY